ncbi:MAG: DUF5666 domain-containing protein [Thermomicrobiales bacterium]
MRRSGTRIGIIAVILLAFVVTGFVAYGRGKTAGQTAASSDRSSFGQARGTSVAGGQGTGGGFGGSGQRAGGGSPSAGGPSAGGTTSAVVGKVTTVDNGTLTLQEQPGNTTSMVATNASTTVTTFAPGALSDLAMGGIVVVQGDKTGDTAYTAKTIYALNGAQGGGRPGQAQGGTDTTAGTAAAGGPASGGRGRTATDAAGSAPSGRGAGFSGLPGLNGPTGRITQISGGTLTLQGFDGSTTTVTTNASTSVRKQTPGMVSDIKVGDTISVQSDPTAGATAPARTITDLGAGT